MSTVLRKLQREVFLLKPARRTDPSRAVPCPGSKPALVNEWELEVAVDSRSTT